MTTGTYRFFLMMLVLSACCCLFVLPMLGRTVYWPFSSVIYEIRFHRTLLALTAGGGLAISGLVFQALFRNSLATPYTLGIASGASFGAALSLRFVVPLTWSGALLSGIELPWISLGALIGSFFAMGVVFLLARAKGASSEQMLLAGVAVNFFFASMIVLLQYVSAPHDALQMLRWTMGGVQDAIAADFWKLGPVVFTALVFLLFLSRELDVIVTGKERAQALGVDVSRLRTILFVVVSIMIGCIVAVTGPIGFVGLMVPHISRMLIGPTHQRLVPVTFLIGAVFLACCDTLGRSLFYPAQLPVGILTSLLGGPFFLWLLLRSERRLG